MRGEPRHSGVRVDVFILAIMLFSVSTIISNNVSEVSKINPLPEQYNSKIIFTRQGNGSSNVSNPLKGILFINEFMADNDGSYTDSQGDYPDWVELYNRGDEEVVLDGMYFTDNLGNPTKWMFPDNVTIPADGHIILWADNLPELGILHLDFKLRANGEELGLVDRDGTTIIDSIIFGKQNRDVSYGRYPDGNPNWEYLTTPTPGWSNDEITPDEEGSAKEGWLLVLLIVILIALVIFIGRLKDRKNRGGAEK